MENVHPEFDPETGTWFVPGLRQEAPTLRELRELLGGSKVHIVGWRPMGTRTAIKAAPLTADRVLAKSAIAKKANRVRQRTAETRQRNNLGNNSAPDPTSFTAESLAPARADEPGREVPILSETAEAEAAKAADAAVGLPASGEPSPAEPEKCSDLSTADGRRAHFANHPPKRKRIPAWCRSRCTAEQNVALDLWAKGVPGPAISRRLGHHTNATVAAHWVPTARERGDPRAVIRQPWNYGKSRNKGRKHNA